MRIILLRACVLVAAFGLAGCFQTADPSNVNAAAAGIGTVVQTVNAAAVASSPKLAAWEDAISKALVDICDWQPSASTAASLAASISKNTKAVNFTAAVNQIAQGTCLVVKSSAMTSGFGLLDRAPTTKYRGIALIGNFVP